MVPTINMPHRVRIKAFPHEPSNARKKTAGIQTIKAPNTGTTASKAITTPQKNGDDRSEERRQHLEQLIDAHRAWIGLDIGDARLAHPQLLRQACLCQAACLAQGAQVLLELLRKVKAEIHFCNLYSSEDICNISAKND